MSDVIFRSFQARLDYTVARYADTLLYDTPRPRDLYFKRFTDISPGEYHTLEKLLALPLSETTLKRISSAKVGTAVKIIRFSSTDAIFVVRIDQEDVDTKSKLDEKTAELEMVRSQIRSHIPKHLVDAEKALVKEIAKLKKEVLSI